MGDSQCLPKPIIDGIVMMQALDGPLLIIIGAEVQEFLKSGVMKNAQNPKNKEKLLPVLDAARMLLLKQGLLSVGMDEFAKASSFSKRTLYKHFGSRENLIAAVVDHDYAYWEEWFFDAVRELAQSGGDSLRAFNEVLRVWVETPEFEGCLFARVGLAPALMPQALCIAADACVSRLRQFILDQARKAGISDPEAYTRSQLVYILVLLGGAAHGLGENIPRLLTDDMQRNLKEQ